MQVFIDESGTFTGYQPGSISVVERWRYRWQYASAEEKVCAYPQGPVDGR